jgi:hypothetical protein
VEDYDGPSSIDRHTGFVRSQGKVADFADIARAQGLLAADLLMHKISLHGLLPNQDTIFGVSAAAASNNASVARQASGSSGACTRCAGSARESSVPMPVGLTLAGLGWSILRRNRRHREKQG